MTSFFVLAYFGPETMMPLTSIVAAVVGIFMMFGRNSLRLVRRMVLGRIRGIGRGTPLPKPHFQVESETRTKSEAKQP
jgi:hypothetical protein